MFGNKTVYSIIIFYNINNKELNDVFILGIKATVCLFPILFPKFLWIVLKEVTIVIVLNMIGMLKLYNSF